MGINILNKPRHETLFSGNEIPFAIQDIEDDVHQVRITIEMTMYGITRSAQIYQTPDDNKQAHCDVSSFADAFLRSHDGTLDFKTLVEKNVLDTGRFIKFRVIAETFGADGKRDESLNDYYKKAILGGTEISTRAVIDRINEFNSFLTLSPFSAMSPNSPAVFSYYNSRESTVQLNATFRSERGQGDKKIKKLENLKPGIYTFHYTYAELQAKLGQDFDEVSFFITHEADFRISDNRKFTVDKRKHEQERMLIFANSIGGFDAVRLLGKAEDKVQFERTQLEHDGFVRDQGVERIRRFEVGSGYLAGQTNDTADLQNYLVNEAMASKMAYLRTDSAFIEVRIENEEARVFRDGLHLDEPRFELVATKVLHYFNKLNEADPIRTYYAVGYIAPHYYETRL